MRSDATVGDRERYLQHQGQGDDYDCRFERRSKVATLFFGTVWLTDADSLVTRHSMALKERL